MISPILYEDINKLKNILKKIKAKNIFLITGKKSYEICGADKIMNQLLKNYEITRFSDFENNPKINDLKNGIELFYKNKFDCVIAIGGGSVIDMAKLINIFAFNPPLNIENPIIKNSGLPLICIPTTAGSGSEATHFAVIYSDKKKYSVAHPLILPNYIILDTCFLKNIPKQIMASACIDALSQSIESYWSINSTEKSREYSKKALKLIIPNIVNSIKFPDKNNLESMLKGSYYAGKAINISKTTAPHAISYIFTSEYGLQHGHAVALTLGEIIEYNQNLNDDDCNDTRGKFFCNKILKELYKILNCKNGNDLKLKINKIIDSIGLVIKLSELGISLNDIPIITKNINTERLKNNPKKINEKDLRKILLNII